MIKLTFTEVISYGSGVHMHGGDTNMINTCTVKLNLSSFCDVVPIGYLLPVFFLTLVGILKLLMQFCCQSMKYIAHLTVVTEICNRWRA